jgi:hypothetical protein
MKGNLYRVNDLLEDLIMDLEDEGHILQQIDVLEEHEKAKIEMDLAMMRRKWRELIFFVEVKLNEFSMSQWDAE